ncbi:MAG TPA: hypothetical protein VKA50_03190 [Gammaproteobacteria bacterium]|nr:hypothetical protein [Gammaproteobacteria bacterium]
MSADDDNQGFVERVRTALDESDMLDAWAEARLRAARGRAVQAARACRPSWARSLFGAGRGVRLTGAAGGLALAGAAVVAVLLWQPGHRPVPSAPVAGDLELITSKNSLEFYRDLDFYEWLQETQKRAG